VEFKELTHMPPMPMALCSGSKISKSLMIQGTGTSNESALQTATTAAMTARARAKDFILAAEEAEQECFRRMERL